MRQPSKGHQNLLWQSTSIGNLEQKKLTPDKLATFYKAVGGNYDCASSFPTILLPQG